MVPMLSSFQHSKNKRFCGRYCPVVLAKNKDSGPAHVKRVTLASEVNFEILMEVDSLIITE